MSIRIRLGTYEDPDRNETLNSSSAELMLSRPYALWPNINTELETGFKFYFWSSSFGIQRRGECGLLTEKNGDDESIISTDSH